MAYLVEHYNTEIVQRLNAAMRGGTYRETLFKELTAKTLEELDNEWREWLRGKAEEKAKNEAEPKT